MEIKASQSNKNSKTKGLVILLVLFVLVMIPIMTSADAIPHSDNDDYHGYLELSAQNVSMPPVDGTITTDQIVARAQPTAIQKRTSGETTVDAIYFISDEDLARLNAAKNTDESVVITLHGQYLYHCPNVGCDRDYSLTGEIYIIVSFTPAPVSEITCTVTFDGNGGTVDGKKRQRAVLTFAEDENGVKIGSSNMPSKVKRDDHKFKGWSTSKKTYKAFTSKTIVKKDMTVFAYWESIADNKDVIEIKDIDTNELDEIKEEESPTDTRYSLVLSKQTTPLEDVPDPVKEDVIDNVDNVKKSSYSKAEFISLAQEQNVPVAIIGNGSVPLFAPEGVGGWAFVNLLLAAMGALMVLVCVILSIGQNRNKKSKWFVLSIIAGIAGIAFFFITENINQNMVLTDQWTIVNAILFIVSVVGVILFLRKKEDEDIEEFIYNY